jgi:peptide/nickel transport system permease protein
MNTVSSPPARGPQSRRAEGNSGPLGVVRDWIGRANFSTLEKFGLVMLAIILFLAVFGPAIAPHATETANTPERLLSPSADHWLGTDQNGMDVFSRILAAPRTDVLIAVIATALSVVIGAPLGVIAGYFEGGERKSLAWLSEGILRLLDVIQAFPVFIFAMVLVAVRGASMTNIIVAAAFVNMPTFLRLVRGEILSLRQRPFAEAARAIGGSDMRIAFRHLLPNALPPVAVQISVTVGFTILLTAGLSFVGAGISPPTPELGSMISTGAKFMISGQWWPSLFPGVALGLIVFTFGIVGETIGRLIQPGGISRAPSFDEEASEMVPTNVPMVGAAGVSDVELGR